MHFSYIPNFWQLIKIFFKKKMKCKFILNFISKNNEFLILSRSSWSIALILEIIFLQRNNKINFFLPKYFCFSALKYIKKENVNFFFYDLDDNHKININTLKNHDAKIDVLLGVNYFGKKCLDNNLFEFCKNNKIILIEDSCHCILPPAKRDFGDFILYSPYKFFGLHKGSIVVFNNLGPNNLNKDYNLKKIFLEEIKKFEKNLPIKKINFLNNLTWFLKKIILNFYIPSPKKIDFRSDSVDNSILYPRIDFFSKKKINYFLSQVFGFVYLRKKSFLIWRSIFENEFRVVNDLDVLNNKIHPYNFCVEVEDESKIKSIYNKCLINKIPVSTWPDNNSYSQFNKIQQSTHLRFIRLFFPIHTLPDQKIKNKINLILNKNNKEVKNGLYKFLFLSESEYSLKLNKYTNIPFIQTPIHINSKLLGKKFFSKKYFQINNNSGEEIAISALYVLNFIFKIYFINRGPIFKNNLSIEVKKEIIYEIIKYFKKKFLSFFLFYPNIPLEDFYNTENKYNFLLFNKPGWQSIKINLGLDITEIKNYMSANFRNLINRKSQLNSFLLIKSNNKKVFDKFFNLYLTDQKKKNYLGFKKKYMYNIFNSNNLDLFVALNQKTDQQSYDIVSGVLLAKSFNTATYLAGYTNDQYKQHNFNSKLIFEAIKYYKKNGFAFFDLGGVDLNTNYSVAKFKKSINNKIYELVGGIFL